MLDEFLWSQKYRPKTVEECILPESIKKNFQEYVDEGEVPSLLINGSQGIGKTTVALAMLNELNIDYILINGSMSGNIDTLRKEIKNFASTVSFSGGRKMVIIDEADGLNANSFQPALRGFMEEYSKNCGFILTSNFKNRIIEPIHSRCAVIDIAIKKADYPALASQFCKRVVHILKSENIEYDKAVVVELVKKHFPDNRRVINELQRYSASGKIDSGILTDLQEVSIKELVSLLKEKNFTEVRKWAAENIDSDPSVIYRKIYDQASLYLTKDTIPPVVLILGKYQYQHGFCADAEINLVCCLTEIMIEASWL